MMSPDVQFKINDLKLLPCKKASKQMSGDPPRIVFEEASMLDVSSSSSSCCCSSSSSSSGSGSGSSNCSNQ